VWKTNSPPLSLDTFGSPRPAPTGIAIDPDNNPIVTGSLLDASGKFVSTTIKYTSAGFFNNNALEFWPNHATDTGPVFGDTSGRAIAADSAGNAIVVGDLRNSDGNSDLFVAKYDSLTGELVYRATFNGSYNSSADTGVDVAVDQFGNISRPSATSSPTRALVSACTSLPRSSSTALSLPRAKICRMASPASPMTRQSRLPALRRSARAECSRPSWPSSPAKS
jgi:hypothetical protein